MSSENQTYTHNSYAYIFPQTQIISHWHNKYFTNAHCKNIYISIEVEVTSMGVQQSSMSSENHRHGSFHMRFGSIFQKATKSLVDGLLWMCCDWDSHKEATKSLVDGLLWMYCDWDGEFEWIYYTCYKKSHKSTNEKTHSKCCHPQ